MKRNLSMLLITLLLLVVFSACHNGENNQISNEKGDHGLSSNIQDGSGSSEKPNSDNTSKPKLNEKINAKTIISEGKMMVRCKSGSKMDMLSPGDVWRCVNMKGEILFEITVRNYGYMSESRFVNGFIPFDEGLCDANGKIVYPEDVGATRFYWQAFDAGYIIAENIIADYSGAKKELGILNTNMEWVVAPSEAFYNEMTHNNKLVFKTYSANSYPYYGLDYLGSGCHYYCQDGYLYIKPLKCFLQLSTGKTVNDGEGPKNQSADSWDTFDKCYYDRNGKLMLSIRNHNNLLKWGNFVDGIAPVMFYNEDVGKYYVSAVNTKGELLFEPKSVPLQNNYTVATDGSAIVVYEVFAGDILKVWSFDVTGNMLGEKDVFDQHYTASHISVEEGVIVFKLIDNELRYDLVTTELEPLF